MFFVNLNSQQWVDDSCNKKAKNEAVELTNLEQLTAYYQKLQFITHIKPLIKFSIKFWKKFKMFAFLKEKLQSLIQNQYVLAI